VALGTIAATILALRLRSELPPKLPLISMAVDTQKTFQTLEGFGASAAYYQDWIATHPQHEAIYAALFGELRLNLLRLRNTYEPGKPGFASAEKAIYAGASKQLGSPPQVMIASWSPPASLKSTGNTKNGGTLSKRNGSYDYAGFAQWWRDSVVAYQSAGLAPNYISIQNEPNWKDTWETCLFQLEESPSHASYSKALDAVSDGLSTLAAKPKLLGPETLGIENPQAFLPPDQVAKVAIVAHHLYSGGKETDPDSFIPALHAVRTSYPTAPKFQTEFGRGDGFQTAWVIQNCLTEEDASAYLYWASAWPSADALITLEKPWEQATWKTPQGFIKTDRFYALEHFSRFLTPGSVRVAASTPDPALRISAFVSPDKSSLVLIALNSAKAQTKALSLKMPGYMAQEAYQTQFLSKERCAPIDMKGTASLVLPAHALVTLIFRKTRP
jgi:glucuronoarabinoxylan endo-1,4-beta-xylanase